jgi:hypothetical protein
VREFDHAIESFADIGVSEFNGQRERGQFVQLDGAESGRLDNDHIWRSRSGPQDLEVCGSCKPIHLSEEWSDNNREQSPHSDSGRNPLQLFDLTLRAEFHDQRRRRHGQRDSDSRMRMDGCEQRGLGGDNERRERERKRSSELHSWRKQRRDEKRDFDHSRTELHPDTGRSERRMQLHDSADESELHIERRERECNGDDAGGMPMDGGEQ